MFEHPIQLEDNWSRGVKLTGEGEIGRDGDLGLQEGGRASDDVRERFLQQLQVTSRALEHGGR